MPKVIGPDTPFSVSTSVQASFDTDAETLGAALSAYARQFDVTFEPYDGRWPELPFDESDPKWFIYKSRRPKWEEVAVDIHVERSGESLCPRQDLSFPLNADDIISIGPLAC